MLGIAVLSFEMVAIGFGFFPEYSIPIMLWLGAWASQKFINALVLVELRRCSSDKALPFSLFGWAYWIFISLFFAAFLYSFFHIFNSITAN